MTRTVTATQAKAQILALLEDVATGDEIQITKHGRVIARLVGAAGPIAARGALSGIASTAAADDDLLGIDAVWDAS